MDLEKNQSINILHQLEWYINIGNNGVIIGEKTN
jgi:hypothetical protein